MSRHDLVSAQNHAEDMAAVEDCKPCYAMRFNFLLKSASISLEVLCEHNGWVRGMFTQRVKAAL